MNFLDPAFMAGFFISYVLHIGSLFYLGKKNKGVY